MEIFFDNFGFFHHYRCDNSDSIIGGIREAEKTFGFKGHIKLDEFHLRQQINKNLGAVNTMLKDTPDVKIKLWAKLMGLVNKID